MNHMSDMFDSEKNLLFYNTNPLLMVTSSSSFRNNFGILVMIISAFVGILICFLMITGFSKKSPFHEIKWRPREIANTLLVNITPDSSSKKLSSKLDNMSDSLLENQYFRKNISIATDTVPNLLIKNGALNQATIKVVWQDSLLPNKRLETAVKLEPYYFNNSYNGFIARYPSFGLWCMLIILQCGFFFYLFPWLISNVFFKSTPACIRKDYNQNNVWKYSIALVLFFVAMWLVLRETGDAKLVTPAFFMEGLNALFLFVNISGYIAAMVSFVGCLKCGAQMLAFSKLHEQGSEYDENEIGCIKDIKSEFKTYFIILAIILSAAVFTTGTFFTGLNSLDFVKQISRSLGHSPLPYDFVYLYGLFHSFLLLLIYLPVSHIISQLEAKINEGKKTDAADPTKSNEKHKSVKE